MRRLWPLLAGVIPLIPIIAGFWLTASPSTSASANASLTPSYRPAGGPGGNRTPGPSTRAGHLVAQSPALAIPGGPGALTAVLARPTQLLRAPGGRPLAHLGLHTEYGSNRVLFVAQIRDHWLGVITPEAGNGRLGWLPAAAAQLVREPYAIEVSLHEHRLLVRELGRIVQTDPVAVGAPASPTPPGRFSVTDLLSTGDPTGPYGCCILALSAKAPHAIQGWSGGDRIAIHSTPESWTIGSSVSHGCVRLSLANGRWLLSHIPLGTPVTIRE